MNSQINVLYPKPAFLGAPAAAVASQSLTVSVTAVQIGTAFVIPGVDLVTFDIQGQNVRVRWDGVAPTGTVGHILYAGLGYSWTTSQFNSAQFIRISTAASDATIFASAMQA